MAQLSLLALLLLAHSLANSPASDARRQSDSECENPEQVHLQDNNPNYCRTLLGEKDFNNTIQLDDDQRYADGLQMFQVVYQKLMEKMAHSLDEDYRKCVRDLLYFGCRVKYFTCANVEIRNSAESSMKLMQPCMSFCNEVAACVDKHGIDEDFKELWNSKSSEEPLTIQAISEIRCYAKSNPGESGKDDFCFYGEISTTQTLKSPETLLLLNPDIKVEKSCQTNDRFLQVEASSECLMKCEEENETLYMREHQHIAYLWIMIWSCVCAFTSGCTVLTYLIDNTRFNYPERPIVLQSLCCLVYALGHVLRLTGGVEGVSCITTEDTNGEEHKVYLHAGNLNGGLLCTVSFMLVYYSQIAIHVWWVVMAVSWFLTAVKGWSQESLEGVSIYFHLIAWIVPAAQTVFILVTKRFEGDPLTGMCLVGAQNSENLLYFIILPISGYLVLGLILITAGFLSMFKIRQHLKANGQKDGNMARFEKQMIRVGLFTVCYLIPTVIYIGLTVYEYIMMPIWFDKAVKSPQFERSIPEIVPLLIRSFLTFSLGIATSLWIWNCKTLRSWARCLCRPCLFSSSNKTKVTAPPAQRFAYNPYNQKNVNNNGYVIKGLPNSPDNSVNYHLGEV